MIELYELNPHKMTTPQKKAECVSWFIETKSDVQTKQNYRSMEETLCTVECGSFNCLATVRWTSLKNIERLA